MRSSDLTSGEARLRGQAPGQHSSNGTMQRWRAAGDTASTLTGLRIEPRMSRAEAMPFTTAN